MDRESLGPSRRVRISDAMWDEIQEKVKREEVRSASTFIRYACERMLDSDVSQAIAAVNRLAEGKGVPPIEVLDDLRVLYEDGKL